ncbi:MAG TPA: GH25 family lysozyme [Tepidisphaeraceae bacterium]
MRISGISRNALRGCASLILALAYPALGGDLGVDVSHFQGVGSDTSLSESTYAQMYSEGDRFVFIKASEGLTGPDDPTMAGNVANADAAGLLTGVYHFAHPENRPTTAGAVLEADHFVAYAGSAISAGHLRPVLDLEEGSGLGATALTNWVIAFCNEVMAQDGTGADPIIYTGFTTLLDSRMSSYDLWLLDQSNPANPSTATPPPGATGNFGNWAFWQYSGDGSAGGISPIDLDVENSADGPLSSFVIVPEPTTLAMVLIGAALLSPKRSARAKC